MSDRPGRYGSVGAAITGGMTMIHASEWDDGGFRLAKLARRPNSRPLIVPFEVATRATAGPDDEDRPACEGMDPELFFPDFHPRSRDDQNHLAVIRQICLRCPRRIPCQESARFEDDGIWGGWTAAERKVRRSKKKRSGRDDI